MQVQPQRDVSANRMVIYKSSSNLHDVACSRYENIFARIIVNTMHPGENHNVGRPRYDIFFARIVVNNKQPDKNHNVGQLQ